MVRHHKLLETSITVGLSGASPGFQEGLPHFTSYIAEDGSGTREVGNVSGLECKVDPWDV